jgi:regulatory protein
MTDSNEIALKELRESPRRPGRYLLTLSDGRHLVVGIAVLAETGATRAGANLTPEKIATLVHESTITELADRALDALARGRRTRRELELRLRKREATPAQIREALDRLEASGLLSDASVARDEAAARLRRGEAPTRVRQQLRRKGVAGPTVVDALADVMDRDDYDEVAACRAVAEKRARSLASADAATAERRLLGFLLRRGYAGGIARQVVRDVLRRGGADA